MLDEVEPWLVIEVTQIFGPPGLEIVNANHLSALADEAVTEVRTDEAGAPRHERNLLVPTLHTMLLPTFPCRLGLRGFVDVALQLGSAVVGGMRCNDTSACRVADRRRVIGGCQQFDDLIAAIRENDFTLRLEQAVDAFPFVGNHRRAA